MNKLFYIQTCCNRIACLMFIDKLDILTFQKKLLKITFQKIINYIAKQNKKI